MNKIIVFLTSLFFIFTIIFPTIIANDEYIECNNSLIFPNYNQKPPKPVVDGKIFLLPQTNGSFFVPVNNNEDVMFDWGDGNQSRGYLWIGKTCCQNYQWKNEGEYSVKVKTYSSIGIESDWSDELIVTVNEGIKDIEYPNGLGYTAIIHNYYSFDFYDLTWHINLDKHYDNNFGILLSGGFANGSIGHVPSLGTVECNSHRLFGLGYFGAEFGFGGDTKYDFFILGMQNCNPLVLVGPFVYNVNGD